MNNSTLSPTSEAKAASHRRDVLSAGAIFAAVAGVGRAIGNGSSAQASSSRPVGAKSASRRRLGSLEVSALGLGCMSMAPGFYNPAPNPQDMVRVIRGAHELGVTFFDTAEVYGPFVSEEILGEALQPIRNEVTLASKFGFAFSGTAYAGRNSRPEHIKQAVEGMLLRRLRTDRIDLVYLHRMHPQVPIADIAGAVGDLIREGKAREFGVSEVNPDTLRGAHAVTRVAAIQSEYSIFERIPEVTMLKTCEELGVGFVPWGPTARALVTDRFNEYSRFASGDRRAAVPFFAAEALEANMKVLRLIREWGDRKGISPVQFALAWLLAQRPWIVPIPGSTRLHHVRENLGALDVQFSSEELTQFRSELEAMPIRGNRPRSAAYESQ